MEGAPLSSSSLQNCHERVHPPDERSLSEETSMSVQLGFTETYHIPAKEPSQNASFFPAL
jgi:hypothetical protein